MKSKSRTKNCKQSKSYRYAIYTQFAFFDFCAKKRHRLWRVRRWSCKNSVANRCSVSMVPRLRRERIRKCVPVLYFSIPRLLVFYKCSNIIGYRGNTQYNVHSFKKHYIAFHRDCASRSCKIGTPNMAFTKV